MSGKSVQKNLRITPEHDRALKAASVESGVSESELLRRGIEQVCVRDRGLLEGTGRREASGRDAARGGAGVQASRGGPSVDLAVWLAGRMGQPRALVRRDIDRGLVEVRGRVVRGAFVSGPLGPGDVRVAGEVV